MMCDGCSVCSVHVFFFYKQKTAYEMRISDWSSDVCSSDLYGVHLRERISPLMTGVGPVEAAVTLTRTLAELQRRDNQPDLVVSLGSAGSARLEQIGRASCRERGCQYG